MLVGIPKETKVQEHRVGLVPACVRELVLHGHKVIVEKGAGICVGFSDVDYEASGATIVGTAEEVFARAEMVVKVKEPQPAECKMLRENQVLFTFLHLAPDPALTSALQESGCVAIAYETVTDNYGGLPLLSPMSEVAGRLAIQAGSYCLEKKQGGAGILLGGVPGVEPGRVTILGGGTVGTNAVMMAIGKGARVTVLDVSLKQLQGLDMQFGNQANTIFATAGAIEKYVLQADLVVGAVLLPGEAAPKLVTRDLVTHMRPGSVVVDVSIDQGGCFETSHPTNHDAPTYVEEGVVHYCVTNMPGVVPKTSSFALNNATLPYILQLADKGYNEALLTNPHLLNGLNVCCGNITHKAVAKNLGKDYMSATKALEL